VQGEISTPGGTPATRLGTSSRVIYCTIVAQNYLPQALTLYSSIREVEPDRDLVILVIDADRSDLEAGRPHLRIATTSCLGISDREILELAAIYDVVEFSTAVKPIFLKSLLESHEQAVYLDPDTFLVAPLVELESLVGQWGIVLTPHFLEPIPAKVAHITEVHDLTVGVHNLGFCAVGRQAVPFLDWWWGHLERECLIYPLLGVFVDQKWTDVGSNLFGAHTLRHYGYNVGPWNLHERMFTKRDGHWTMERSGQPLRFLHFSGFDAADADAISERLNLDMRRAGVGSLSLSELSHVYAERIVAASEMLGASPPYRFGVDCGGRRITKRTRRAYRKALLKSSAPSSLPSPFLAGESRAFSTWRRRALLSRISLTAADAAIALKYGFPDEFSFVRRTMLRQFSWVREHLLSASRVRR
jgi:hypothetical protein